MAKIDRHLGNSRAVVCCKLIFDQITHKLLNHKVRHVVGSILISKYRSWCTLTFLKCVKKGKLCQNATLN